jgi:hypothetical protein
MRDQSRPEAWPSSQWVDDPKAATLGIVGKYSGYRHVNGRDSECYNSSQTDWRALA